MPDSFTRGQPIAQLQGQDLKCLRPLFGFRRHGQSGQEIADILPHIATIADEIAMIHKGVIVWQGQAKKIDRSGNAFVDQFIHGRAEGPIKMAVKA